ncbi:hypothetical protein LSAT2_009377 [Lamellibrachia satsuma]|nr:hypothetical protein LSAT2_009377 [Lamellibrachia satsuma]
MEGDVSRGRQLHAHGRRRVKRDRATRTWKETCQEGDSYMHMEGDVSRGIALHATERARDCMKHYLCGSGKLECTRRDVIGSGKRLRHLRWTRQEQRHENDSKNAYASATTLTASPSQLQRQSNETATAGGLSIDTLPDQREVAPQLLLQPVVFSEDLNRWQTIHRPYYGNRRF